MKRSFWIVGTAVLAVLAIGGGVTWWLLASAQNDVGLPALDTSELVYTGEDLADFLIGEKAVGSVMGIDIELSDVSNRFVFDPGVSFEPEVCGSLDGSAIWHPAGFRIVSGPRLGPNANDTSSITIRHAAYQFATIRDARDAFAQVTDAAKSCSSYVLNLTGGGAISVELSNVKDVSDQASVVGVILEYSSAGTPLSQDGVVTALHNNVLTIAEIDSAAGADQPVTEDMLRKLASAMSERAVKAQETKADAAKAEAQEPASKPFTQPAAKPAPSASSEPESKAWVIGFGSIGPADITMTAKQAIVALGSTVAMPSPEPEDCWVFDLGWGLVGLASSEGALGRLDTIQTKFTSGEEQTNLPKDRPRTAEGIANGSTFADVQAAYPNKLEIRNNQYSTSGHRAFLYGPDNTVMTFTTGDDDIVQSIMTGRVPQAQYIEGCN